MTSSQKRQSVKATQQQQPQQAKTSNSEKPFEAKNPFDEAMIATATGNTGPEASRLAGWMVEGVGEDGGTVISEITSDLTARGGFNHDDSLDDILGRLQQTCANATATKTPPSSAKKVSTTTPSTAHTTPDHAVLKMPGSPKKGDDGSYTDKPSSTKTPSTASAATAKAAVKAVAAKAAAKAAAKGSSSKSSKSTASTKNGKHKTPPTTPTTASRASSTSPTAPSTPTTASRSSALSSSPPHPAVSPNLHVKSKVGSPPMLNASPNLSTSPKAATRLVPSSPEHHTPLGDRKPAPVVVTPTSTLKAPPSGGSNSNSPTGMSTLKTPPPGSSSNSPTNKALGLSELSKQLRVQRAKNEWQHNEIARLERQLRILSDLKGVSVADLKFSLESACAEEAHGELRNQVQSLQAQLEALQMQRTTTRRASTANTEAAQAKIATLQLRIGELEEVDHAKQQEVQTLYKQLQGQTAKATTLEAANAQQKAQLNKFEQVAKVYIKDVEKIQAERDALKEQVADLMKQVEDQKAARNLDKEMRDIEAQIQLEQQRKQEYLAEARRRQAGSSNKSVVTASQAQNAPPGHVNNRLSGTQFAAIQGIVARQAGVPVPAQDAMAASKIATSRHHDGDNNSVAGSSVATGPHELDVDEVSRLGDDPMDMSVHTMDALMMQGLTEEQAKEALAKDAKIASLYDELRDQATKASQLQTLCANQKTQLDRFAKELNEKEGALRSTQNNYDFAKNEHDSIYKRFCEIELQLTLEQEKVQGLEHQLQARIHESNLRNDQFKCRFQVQNERIADLEQQQQSLYAAFELLQQEVRAQDSEHNKLKSSLDEADSEVARQLVDIEKKGGSRRSSRRSSSHRHLASSSASQRNLLESSSRSFSRDASFDVPPVATATPVDSQIAAYARLSNQESAYDEIFREQSVPIQLPQGVDHPMRHYGYLWKLDKIKGWKRRFFVLYGENGVYQMTYSDGPKDRVKGTINNITMGVSTVAETNKSIKKPFSFVLHVDPLQHSAQVLYAAAMTSDDFKKWMAALKAATIRPEDSMYMSQPNLSHESQLEADMEMARRLQSASSRDLGRHGDIYDAEPSTQEESDHLMAMRMQIQNQQHQAFA